MLSKECPALGFPVRSDIAMFGRQQGADYIVRQEAMRKAMPRPT